MRTDSFGESALAPEDAVMAIDSRAVVTVPLCSAMSDDTAALMWRAVKIVIALDAARASPGSEREVRRLVGEMAGVSGAWLERNASG